MLSISAAWSTLYSFGAPCPHSASTSCSTVRIKGLSQSSKVVKVFIAGPSSIRQLDIRFCESEKSADKNLRQDASADLIEILEHLSLFLSLHSIRLNASNPYSLFWFREFLRFGFKLCASSKLPFFTLKLAKFAVRGYMVWERRRSSIPDGKLPHEEAVLQI
jgi:hypothetical protein